MEQAFKQNPMRGFEHRVLHKKLKLSALGATAYSAAMAAWAEARRAMGTRNGEQET